MKEWQHHIAHTQKGRETESLCGLKNITMEFHFLGLDHWFNNRLRGGMSTACLDCLDTLQMSMNEEYEICGSSLVGRAPV